MMIYIYIFIYLLKKRQLRVIYLTCTESDESIKVSIVTATPALIVADVRGANADVHFVTS
jgi:hypothetical protein